MKFVVFIATIVFLALSVSSDLSGRIFNGHEAVAGQFNYIAAVLTPSRPPLVALGERDICGGTLIAAMWIVTAAHCLYEKDVAKIYLGSIDRHDAVTKYRVKNNKFFLHPEYKYNILLAQSHPGYNESLWNDIALINIPYTEECDKIEYARLAHPATNIREGVMAFVVGWGQIGDHGRVTKRLRWAFVEIISNEICNRWYGDIIDSDLCVNTKRPYGSHCVGDSGGPLISSETGELIGVASAVSEKIDDLESGCEVGIPAIFARITSHMSWITDVTGVTGNPEPIAGVIDTHELNSNTEPVPEVIDINEYLE